VCTADTPILAPLDLVAQLVDDEIQRDLGHGAGRTRGDPPVAQVQDHRAPRVVGNARIALVGEVDLGAREVVSDALEPTELALRHRPQARGDLDVVTPNDHIHARPSTLAPSPPIFEGGVGRRV
jgi:hypothetical protein